MSRPFHVSARASKCFPRVSGDEPRSYLNLEDLSGFSPRERG